MFDLARRIVRSVSGGNGLASDQHSACEKPAEVELWKEGANTNFNYGNPTKYRMQHGRRQDAPEASARPRDRSYPRTKQRDAGAVGTSTGPLSGNRHDIFDDKEKVASNEKSLMPSPSTRLQPPSNRKFEYQSISGGRSFNGEVDARTMGSRGSKSFRLDGLSEAQYERIARDHARAFRIEPESGFWYRPEAGLLEHLHMRAYEPLLPLTWAPDFKTYPARLFNLDPDDTPLITSLYSPQFHAIRALRELVETGHQVRDQLQASLRPFKIQRTIQMQIEAYIDWALSDADFYPGSQTIPIHCILQRRPKQKTEDAIVALADAMCDLLAEHRRFFQTPSALRRSPTPHELKRETTSNSPAPPASPGMQVDSNPQIIDDPRGRLPPVMIGFLIVGPTATIFTLNARNADAATLAEDPTRGIHMLGRFNFTESRYDVWNALAIAIAACHLRTALQAMANPTAKKQENRLLYGTLAGYVGKEQHDAVRKRKREETDGEDKANDHGRKKRRATPKGKGKPGSTACGHKRRTAATAEDSDPDR